MGCVWSSIPVAFFQIMTANAYIFMYAIQRQFNQDHAKSYKRFHQLKEEKSQEEKRQ